MKKTLCVLFAVIFAFSCISVIAYAADATAEAKAESSSDSTIIIPETIKLENVTYVICPYCDTVCGSSEAYASHLEGCAAYQSYKVESKENVCYYCGATLKNEKALNQHYAYYVNETNHVKNCCYSGKFYKDGGCPCKFTIKAEYEKHVAMCPYVDQYSTLGYLRLIVTKIKEIISGIEWGEILNALKAIFGGMDFGTIKDLGGAIVNTVKGFDSSEFEGIGFDEIKGIFF